MTVPPQESGPADFCIPAIAVDMQLHLFVLDCAPKVLNQDVVVATLPA